MSILVIAEHDNNNIKGSTLNTVAAASEISGEISLLVAGSNCTSVLEEAQIINNVSKIISVDDEKYANFLAEDMSLLVLSIANNYKYIMAPAPPVITTTLLFISIILFLRCCFLFYNIQKLTKTFNLHNIKITS